MQTSWNVTWNNLRSWLFGFYIPILCTNRRAVRCHRRAVACYGSTIYGSPYSIETSVIPKQYLRQPNSYSPINHSTQEFIALFQRETSSNQTRSNKDSTKELLRCYLLTLWLWIWLRTCFILSNNNSPKTPNSRTCWRTEGVYTYIYRQYKLISNNKTPSAHPYALPAVVSISAHFDSHLDSARWPAQCNASAYGTSWRPSGVRMYDHRECVCTTKGSA